MLSSQQVSAMVLTAFFHHTEGEAEFTYPVGDDVYAVRAEQFQGRPVAAVYLRGELQARFEVEVVVRPL